MSKLIKTVHLGRTVLCDSCNKDYSNSDASGGFLFGSHAICPECETNYRATVKGFGEEWNIKGECPKGMSFRDWVIDVVCGGKERTVKTFEI